MGVRSGLGTLLEVLAVVVIVAMVAGQVLGQPVLLGYVTSDSMEPTLQPGDGFVAIPAAVSGPVETGDVVVFNAETLNGGGLTTHRVVEETDRGYVTKGDGNPFTDQDDDEPVVRDEQVVAHVWQPGGDVLAIPGLGTVVTGTQSTLETVQARLAALFDTRALLGTQGLAYLVLAVSMVLYVLDVFRDDGRDREERNRSRETGWSTRAVLAVFAAAIVLAATASMVVPAGPQKFGIVSAETEGSGLSVIQQGTNESTPYPVSNGGLVPVVVFLEPGTEGVSVDPGKVSVPPRSSVNATLTLTAPPETGYYRLFLDRHRYLAILPQPVIETLHGVHPWLPIVVIDAILGGSFYLAGLALVGTGRIRSRSREKPSRLDRLT